MGKRPLVSNEELDSLRERANDISADMIEITRRIRADLGSGADVETPAAYASVFAGLAARTADLAGVITYRLGHEEERRKLEAELRSRS